ncbi:hypothetical protein GQ53DRAFT_543469 [Thozetella sp. PMI_491]|nr:hypothetical protein GQ53DRAFT_543469 [Thozetella sp. PMI_491]
MESAAGVAHRKIELQDPEDLTFLINNVRRAAADSINAAFPPVEGAEGEVDELRVRIEELVNEYIARTFTLAAPNLAINGMPVDPAPFLSGDVEAMTPEEHFEAFDGRKRQRVEELAREEEDLLREIAALKRRVPKNTADAYAESTRAGVAADAEAADVARDRVRDAASQRAMLGKDGRQVGLPRQAEVERAFADAVATLERLKRDMPATVAKMERARVAGEYVVTER